MTFDAKLHWLMERDTLLRQGQTVERGISGDAPHWKTWLVRAVIFLLKRVPSEHDSP